MRRGYTRTHYCCPCFGVSRTRTQFSQKDPASQALFCLLMKADNSLSTLIEQNLKECCELLSVKAGNSQIQILKQGYGWMVTYSTTVFPHKTFQPFLTS